ncbi:MAG TPA: hypothetical protein VN698_15415 [Bacteroidia bacterium]|nr:hypothetical protein [Bacteroidia bacterium]
MNEVTKNKFAEMLKAANDKANFPAKVKASEKIVETISKAKEVNILGQTVKEGTKIHAKLTQQIRQFNELAASEVNMPELSEVTYNDLIAPIPELPNKPQANLTVINYSDKAIAIIGETYPVKDVLKRIGGRFNYNLTCGAGWIFSKAKAELLRKELNLNFVL